MKTMTGAGFVESADRKSGKKTRNTRPGRRLLLLSILLPLSAFALADPLRFDIPAQPLATALKAFADQAKMQLLYQPDAISTGTSSAVVGDFDKRAALELLLKDTGLEVVFSKGNAATIRPVRSAAKVTHLPSSGDSVAEGEGEDAETASSRAFRLAQAETSSRSEGSDNEAASRDREQQPAQLEEVIVTATKRAENIQDVPISIAVVSADEIDRRGLVNAEDYLRGMPGVNQVGGSGALSGQAIVIRGMETNPNTQNFFSGPTTATYFGETPTTSSAGLSGGSNIDIKLVDIERVEVLRGPQGTAFGSSSIGGAVRTIPVAPKLNRVEGKVAAAYSVTADTGGDNYSMQGVGNIPLIEGKLAIRATAYQFQDSGFYRNRAGSDAASQAFATARGAQAFAIDQEEVGAYYAVGGRIAALFQASDSLKFTLSYLRQQTEADGFAFATSGTYEQTLLRVTPEHVRRGRTEGLSDYDIGIANAVMEYDFGWADLLATYSHVKADSVYTAPFQVFNVPWAASFERPMAHRANVGEVRLATRLDAAWNFLTGLYVEELDDEYASELIWFGDAATSIVPGQRRLLDYLNVRDLQQRAAFGEVSWEFLPRFTLTAGMRAYEYDRAISIDQGGPLAGADSSVESETSGENFRANLSYKPGDNAHLYVGWAQGFRLGRPQPPMPPRCDADGNGLIDGTQVSLESAGRVDPDSVDNYELGGKFALLDRRLTIDAALFRMDWSDIPVSTIPPCFFSYLTNAGEARSEGIELQTSFRLTEALRVDFGGSYVDATLTEDAPTLGAAAGARLPSPKVNANLGLQYEFDIAGHAAFVRVDSIYVGDFYADLRASPNSKAGDYMKLDASARVAIRNLNVDFFARNLTNEDAFTARGAGPYSEFYGYRLRPRTIGMQLSYDF